MPGLQSPQGMGAQQLPPSTAETFRNSIGAAPGKLLDWGAQNPMKAAGALATLGGGIASALTKPGLPKIGPAPAPYTPPINNQEPALPSGPPSSPLLGPKAPPTRGRGGMGVM